jgi:MoaA/NifB/PqqE/SkfB family radical SAM enzyme
MCFAWKRTYVKAREEPTLNEWHNFIGLLADLSNNSLEINFSGAEPLFDERNLALISFCTNKGLPTSMNTNGFLIDKDMACKLADSGLNSITISLDGINKNTHDFLRGVEGCYDKIMQGIDYLNGYCGNLTIGIQTIILENNLDEIIGLTEWVNERKRINHICFQAIAQPFFTLFDNDWHKKTEYNILWPKDIKKVHAVIDELIRLKKAGFKISNPVSQLEVFKAYFERPDNFIKKATCNVDFYMTINEFGDVRMCGRMQIIGNIRKDGPKDIWYSKEANQIREEIKNCRVNCHHLLNCCYEEE